MTIKPIRTKADYQKALTRLEAIFEAKPGSQEGDELEVLTILIDNYEKEKFPIGLPEHGQYIGEITTITPGFNESDLVVPMIERFLNRQPETNSGHDELRRN